MTNYEAINKISTAKTIALIGHATPDADALCSMVVFKNFLKSKFNVSQVDMFADCKKLNTAYLQILDGDKLNPNPLENYDFVITLDSSNIKLLGNYANLKQGFSHNIN